MLSVCWIDRQDLVPAESGKGIVFYNRTFENIRGIGVPERVKGELRVKWKNTILQFGTDLANYYGIFLDTCCAPIILHWTHQSWSIPSDQWSFLITRQPGAFLSVFYGSCKIFKRGSGVIEVWISGFILKFFRGSDPWVDHHLHCRWRKFGDERQP